MENASRALRPGPGRRTLSVSCCYLYDLLIRGLRGDAGSASWKYVHIYMLNCKRESATGIGEAGRVACKYKEVQIVNSLGNSENKPML